MMKPLKKLASTPNTFDLLKNKIRKSCYSKVVGWGSYVGRYAQEKILHPKFDIEPGSSLLPITLSAQRLWPQSMNLTNHENKVKDFEDNNVLAVGAGFRHSMIAAVLRPGEHKSGIVAFGLNGAAQLGVEPRQHNGPVCARFDIDGMATSISCGREHSIILTKLPTSNTDNGRMQKMWVCGNNMCGQLGIGKSKHTTTSKETTLVYSALTENKLVWECLDHDEDITSVECGLDHSVILTSKGRVFAMGWGADGQIGTGPNDMDDKDIPTLVSGLDGVNIKKISTSTDFTLALSDENQVFFWGNGEYGQFPTSDENFIDRIPEATLMPSPVEGKLIDIAAGGTFSAFLSDNGYVYVCGYGAVGMGQNNTLSVNNYTAIPSLSDIVAIRASTDYMVALDAEKRVFVWGFNSLTGRLGTGNIENVHEPTQLKLPEHINAPNNLNSLSLGTQLALWALN